MYWTRTRKKWCDSAEVRGPQRTHLILFSSLTHRMPLNGSKFQDIVGHPHFVRQSLNVEPVVIWKSFVCEVFVKSLTILPFSWQGFVYGLTSAFGEDTTISNMCTVVPPGCFESVINWLEVPGWETWWISFGYNVDQTCRLRLMGFCVLLDIDSTWEHKR